MLRALREKLLRLTADAFGAAPQGAPSHARLQGVAVHCKKK